MPHQGGHDANSLLTGEVGEICTRIKVRESSCVGRKRSATRVVLQYSTLLYSTILYYTVSCCLPWALLLAAERRTFALESKVPAVGLFFFPRMTFEHGATCFLNRLTRQAVLEIVLAKL